MWVRQMGTWSIWLDPEGYLKIMWGYGIPGAGKTILASIVINTLEAHARASTSPICVNYIYFRYSDHTKATIKGFLDILVKQTVERHPHYLPLFDEVFAKHLRENTQPSEEELLSLYRQFSSRMLVTFCILDALDEAPPSLQLEILEKLAAPNVKLFVTSRPLKAVEARFPDAFRFSIVARDQDIDLHIDKEISRSADLRELLEEGDPSLRDEIATSIKEKCGGMFLHASLQLEALPECTSVYEVQETLATFSTEIEGLYLEAWKRITSQTRSKVSLAKKVLLWVINATRSLTVDELRHALATSPETHKFESSRLVQEGALIGLCRGLVAVEEETRLVRLVHYTAKDTLGRIIAETFQQPHALLSAVCLACLTDNGFQRIPFSEKQQLEQALKPETLLSYAYDSWSAHARKSLADPLTSRGLSDFIENCHAFPLRQQWLGAWHVPFDILSPLHVVACFNLPIALAGSHNLQNPNQTTAIQGVTALHLACAHGHDGAVEELLLLPNILVNVVNKGGGITPLISASEHGRDGAIRLLLTRSNLNANAVDRGGWTALLWASVNGHKAAVALLLSHPDVDVNATDVLGVNALICASERGHEDVVQLFLSRPDVDVGVTNWLGQTALCVAAGYGYKGTVKLLLGHPQVDVNVVDQSGHTALSQAAENGEEGVVRLLLTHPSIQVGTRELEVAKDGGNRVIVSLLEEFLNRP
ncbi:ankyrin repeat-containing domain protein [Coprinopsis sp. MPI-PUGE-AT-0042]|nr:ankyrin repeat-containing domain protein [Coprinopsis sp. MPI-PUGE-AT-0042]